MGYTTSTVHGIEVPNSSEANDVPEDIGKVVTALESGSLVKRLTGAAIAALTAPQKPAGLVVYNTTANTLQVSDGTNFRDVPSFGSSGAWTAWTPTLGQGGTVTWDAGASRARYLQVGKLVTAYCELKVTGSGVAGQPITVSLPAVAVAVGAGGGTFYCFDPGVAHWVGAANVAATTYCALYRDGATDKFGVAGPTLGAADVVSMSVTYEIA